MLNGALWSSLTDLIEGDDDQKFAAMVNVTCLRFGLIGPGALAELKCSCKTIIEYGFVPLLAVACHRKSANAMIAVTATLFLPMSLGEQIEKLERAPKI